jgi:RNA polymerase sigma-70 factor (sigma-E family)
LTDDPELDAFCATVRPRLVGTLALYCGDAAVGEELAQETLARVWARWPRVRHLQSPAGWAHRVGINLARSHLRRRLVARRARARLGVDIEALHEHDREAALDVRRAVAGLPPRQRAALVLRYYTDLSVDETADVLGCAPGTVKSLTHKALATLRQRLPHLAAEPAAVPFQEASDV